MVEKIIFQSELRAVKCMHIYLSEKYKTMVNKYLNIDIYYYIKV